MSEDPLTPLESATPLAVEAYFRYNSEALFTDFIRANAPRFQNFRESNRDKGFDLQMFLVQKEYLALVESKLSEYLQSLNITEARFMKASSEAMGKEGDKSSGNARVVEELIDSFNRYRDFESFGEMMEDRFLLAFPAERARLRSMSAGSSGEPVPDPPASVTTSGAVSQKCVRVLWDIENIPVSRHVGGIRTVKRLTDFLKGLNLAGTGVDHRITAFFNPDKMREKVLRELDAGSVELVWVGQKQEDADRKLCMRINQEMSVLPPESTFVLVSSDKDFRSQMQLLSSRGFNVIVMHNANNANWAASLELHASAAYRWDSVINSNIKSEGDAEGEEGALGPANETDAGADQLYHDLEAGRQTLLAEEAEMDKKREVVRRTLQRPVRVQLVTGGYTYVEAEELYVWHKGVCLRWRSSWGFVCVAVRQPAVSIEAIERKEDLACSEGVTEGKEKETKRTSASSPEQAETASGEAAGCNLEKETEIEAEPVPEVGIVARTSSFAATLLPGSKNEKNLATIRTKLQVEEGDGWAVSDGLTVPAAGGEAGALPSVVLAKVYVNVKSLSLLSGQSFLDRDQMVKVLVEPAGKGPKAKRCEDQQAQ